MDGDTFGSNLPRRSVPHRPSPWDFAAKELTNLVKDDKRVIPMLAGCPEFSWIFRKFDIYLIAVEVGGYLYEPGKQIPCPRTRRKNRWLEYATLTGYGETYGELLRRSKIVGTILSKKVFQNAAREVSMNQGNLKFWKHSFGIKALTIRAVIPKLCFQNIKFPGFILNSRAAFSKLSYLK
ncbi:hypothetical protein Tco_0641795 [Tanacetum coccineum]